MFGLTDTAKAIIGLISLCLVAFLAWKGLSAVYTMGYNAANVRAEKVIGEFMAAEAQAQRDARTAERKAQDAVNLAAAEYERGMEDAKQAQARTVAGLRDGTIRLREQWRGCEASRLSDSAEAAALIEYADQRRAEAAGRIVRVGAECDARQLAWERYAEALMIDSLTESEEG